MFSRKPAYVFFFLLFLFYIFFPYSLVQIIQRVATVMTGNREDLFLPLQTLKKYTFFYWSVSIKKKV